MYSILVGNLGMVMETPNYVTAKWTFDEYVEASKQHNNRASGEPVTMMENGEIVMEFAPTISKEQAAMA